jgi:PAS domain S-box-containing protein/diguanylate cyclase (GGDEF)-like protein
LPYVICPNCGSRAYSAAGRATVEECPVCHAPLPRPRTAVSGPEQGATPRPLPKRRTPAVRAAIAEALGRVPALFEPAFANPRVIRELWRQTQVEWLNSPIPARFRRAVLGALAERSAWPWAVVADGISPPPDAEGEEEAPAPDWPPAESPLNDELLSLTLRLVLDGPDPEVTSRLLEILSSDRYACVLAMVSYLDTCRTFAQAHPDLVAAAGSDSRRTSDPKELAVLELQSDGEIVSASPAAEELLERPAAALIGRPLGDFLSHDKGVLERLLAELSPDEDQPLREQSLKVVGRRRDGTAFDAALTLANRGRSGQPGVMTAVVDVGVLGGRPDYVAAYRVLVSLVQGRASSLRPDAALAAVAQTLGWSHMLVWRFDRDARVLRCAAVHQLVDDAKSSDELKQRAAMTFTPGRGMVGSVFETRAPAWVQDLGAAGWSTLGSGLWLPIEPEGHIEGVLEFVSVAGRRPDHALFEMFATFARDAGAVLGPGGQTAAGEPAPAGSGAHSQLAFEGAATAMAVIGVDAGRPGVMTEVNRAMEVLTGSQRSDLVGVPLDELVDPEDVAVDADLMRQLFAREIPAYEITKRIRHADGHVILVELSVSLVRDSEGQEPRYLIVQLADVTERRRIEEAMHVSRDRLASVFEDAPIGMALATLDGRWLQVNNALCETLGYEESELFTKGIGDLIAPDELDAVNRYLRQLIAGDVLGYHVETRALRSGGEAIWIQLSVSLIPDYEGTPAYVLAEVQDISERKRIEEELEQGALLDALTGLPSRTLLFDRLSQACARVGRTGSPFAVMFAAVEGLEAVRQGFGADRMEAAHREVAARLSDAVRAADTVARYSTDEFVIVCEDLDSPRDPSGIAERVLELAQFTVGDESATVPVSVTLGLTVATEPDPAPAVLVERADAAMQFARGADASAQEYSDSV